MKSDSPLLSVCLITYNHGPYINEAMDSIIMQQVNFAWEIIIADDFSTDSTREIILDYKNKYPNLIRLIFQEKNVGPAKNWLDLKYASKAKYIAYLEGDDYWTDKNKLQKQVDLLESNSQYSISCHNAVKINSKGETDHQFVLPASEQRDHSAEEMMKGQWILSCTICYRNVLGRLPEEIFRTPNGDFFLTVLLGEHGACKFQSDISPSHYRIHEGGTWSNIKQVKQWMNQAQTYHHISKYFDRKKKKKFVTHYIDLFLKKSKDIYKLQLENNEIIDAKKTRKNTLLAIYNMSGVRVYWACRKQFSQIKRLLQTTKKTI